MVLAGCASFVALVDSLCVPRTKASVVTHHQSTSSKESDAILVTDTNIKGTKNTEVPGKGGCASPQQCRL